MGILTRSAKQAAMLSAVLSALVAGIVYLLGYPEFSRGLLIGMLAGVGFFYIMCDQNCGDFFCFSNTLKLLL